MQILIILISVNISHKAWWRNRLLCKKKYFMYNFRYTNQRNGSLYNLFYSTPSCYLKALHDLDLQWPTNNYDFFPYSSDPHAFWTGYFSSRPTVKYFERMGNNLLQVRHIKIIKFYIYILITIYNGINSFLGKQAARRFDWFEKLWRAFGTLPRSDGNNAASRRRYRYWKTVSGRRLCTYIVREYVSRRKNNVGSRKVRIISILTFYVKT